jgi:hypothetical protein
MISGSEVPHIVRPLMKMVQDVRNIIWPPMKMVQQNQNVCGQITQTQPVNNCCWS